MDNVIGPTGPSGLPGPSFNATLYGTVTTSQTVPTNANITLDNIPIINTITYQNGNITIQEDGLYSINVDALVRTASGQVIRLEIQRITPTQETILPLSSGTYVNSGTTVDIHGNALFYANALDVISIVNTSEQPITLETTGQNALNLSIFKIAE